MRAVGALALETFCFAGNCARFYPALFTICGALFPFVLTRTIMHWQEATGYRLLKVDGVPPSMDAFELFRLMSYLGDVVMVSKSKDHKTAYVTVNGSGPQTCCPYLVAWNWPVRLASPGCAHFAPTRSAANKAYYAAQKPF